MIWIVAVVLMVVTGLAYVVIVEDKPRYLRGKEVSFLRDMAYSFAMNQAEGSILVMGHGERLQLIEILKGPDTGETEQEVRFIISVGQLASEERRTVAAAISRLANGVLAESWDDATSTAYLETTIRGVPDAIADEALSLAQAVVAALGLGVDQRFTFHMRGELDMRIWRRLNRDKLEDLSHGNVIQRWFGRGQLGKLDQDE